MQFILIIGGWGEWRERKKPRLKIEARQTVESERSSRYSAGFFTYLSSHEKNSRFQVSEFWGWNT